MARNGLPSRMLRIDDPVDKPLFEKRPAQLVQRFRTQELSNLFCKHGPPASPTEVRVIIQPGISE
jgi:hypothetical protein